MPRGTVKEKVAKAVNKKPVDRLGKRKTQDKAPESQLPGTPPINKQRRKFSQVVTPLSNKNPSNLVRQEIAKSSKYNNATVERKEVSVDSVEKTAS